MELLDLRSSVVYRKKTSPLETQKHIHTIIAETFNEAELRSLIFKISERERQKSHGRNDDICTLTYESLPGEGLLDTVLELVLFMRRHGRYPQFKKFLSMERDWVAWDDFK